VKYCEKHRVFDEELSEMKQTDQPIERIRDTEKRKRSLDSEWRNTALELNAIYSTWAQTVYDKQKGLPSRLPPERSAHFDIIIDDGEESE
jgi:hypothetical protein